MNEMNADILLNADEATRLAARFLAHWGVSERDAEIVADHLVENDRRGVPSHGLLRLPQYAEEIERGEIDPQGQPAVAAADDGPTVIDGRRCLGPVACVLAVEEVIAQCQMYPMGVVTIRQAGHCGRIGAYTEALAARGLIGLAFCSGPRSGHRVAPFGGTEGRLATNPIAYAFQTSAGLISSDFSTSVVPEGKVRLWHHVGQAAPPGVLRDALGRESHDPAVLYDTPAGTIQPLGGEFFGYKGTALGLLVEVLATVYSGEDSADITRVGNNVTMIALTPPKTFVANASRLAAYVRSARPIDPAHPVLLPGELESSQRGDSRVHIAQDTWRRILATAKRKGLDIPEAMA